ncbi:MAG TPA: hypothetical protein VNN21_03390 [Dehalococcoidia bacterium]|nr:hypothetical protein [Dehalococcoidia bacterium]
MWGPGSWGVPMWGVWWIVPLLGLLFIVAMMIFCARMRRGVMGDGVVCSHRGRRVSETDDLRREVHELREEIRQVRGGS